MRSITTRSHIRVGLSAAVAVTLSLLGLVTTATPSHATGSDCAVDLRLDGTTTWTDHLALGVGDLFWVRHSGRLPDMAVQQEFTQSGATEPHLFGIWIDGAGDALDSFWFDPGDEGSWTLRAYQLVDGVDVCPAFATFDVVAAPAASLSPTPAPALPDTAMPALRLPAVPLGLIGLPSERMLPTRQTI